MDEPITITPEARAYLQRLSAPVGELSVAVDGRPGETVALIYVCQGDTVQVEFASVFGAAFTPACTLFVRAGQLFLTLSARFGQKAALPA